MAIAPLVANQSFNFLKLLLPANAPPVAGKLQQTSHCKVFVNGKAVCLRGSTSIKVSDGYIASPYSIPGNLLLNAGELKASQSSKKISCNGKPLLLASGQFESVGKVLVPAQQPSVPPAPSTTMRVKGHSVPVNMNNKVQIS